MRGEMLGSSSGRANEAVDDAIHALMGAPVPPLPRGQAKELEQRIALRIETILVRAADRAALRARYAKGLRLAAVLVAAAAAVLSTVVLLRPNESRAVAQITMLSGAAGIRGGAGARVAPALAHVPLAAGEELHTGPDGVARVSLTTGAAVEVSPKSVVRFLGQERRDAGFDETVALEWGRVFVDVPPLLKGDSFSVRTPDAVVTVHGTRFSVERRLGAAGDANVTRVEVVEGHVSVQSATGEHDLRRGESWSSQNGDALADGGRTEVAIGSPAASGDVSIPEVPAPASATPKDRGRTTLGAENQLLAAAMEARRHGQPKRALERLDRLLHAYPDSPLAEIARIERRAALEMLAQGRNGARP